MNGRLDLEEELRVALALELGSAKGDFPEWGQSPQSRRAQAWPGRSIRSLMPGRLMVGAAAVLVLVVGAGLFGLAGAGPIAGLLHQNSCAGCEGSAIWAVAAIDSQHVVGVGGTDDYNGRLVLVRSEDGGKTWSVEHPNAPALTSLALAGDRLYGSTECLPTYPQDYGLPSDEWGYPPATDRSIQPAPASCLYFSDDRGKTWHDADAGRLVDPSFADALHGWAHSPDDWLGQTPTTLYSTSDGGRTWHAESFACDPNSPWIREAVATGAGAGYVLCTAHQGPAWQIMQVRPGMVADVRSSTHTSALEYVGGLYMRPDGSGWISASSGLYLTTDRALTWTLASGQVSPGWGYPQGASAISDATAFAAFRSTGAKSGILMTGDGGSSWRVLIAWDWWSFEPLPLPSQGSALAHPSET
jgi:hypothetical protein